MPRYGANAFIWIDDWTTAKGDYAIGEASRLGFDFIEIPLMKPEKFQPKAHKKALKKAKIGATASLILPERAHMPAHPRRAKKFLISVLENLEAVGGTYLCGCIAFAGGVFTGNPATEAERQVVIDTLGEVCRDAKKRGITVGLECVNRYETYLYNALEDARQTIKAVGADNLQLHADTYHMNIEENDFYKPLASSGDVLGYIHMSESHRGQIGTGTVNWEQVFHGLKDANYQGPLVLESFSANNPELIAAIRLWRPPEQSSEELAREGLKFLKEWSERVAL
jgi:D-psicose/D-tagatose/L-ribulose 3-epimerase